MSSEIAATVNFYILESAERFDQVLYQLSRKAWMQFSMAQLVADSTDLEYVDALLWEIDPDSFLPHAIGEIEHGLSICDTLTIPHSPVLINISAQPLLEARAATKILEIITPNRKEQGRRHYKMYQECGFTLNHHTL